MRCKMSQHTSSRKAYTSTSLKKWLSIDKSYLEGVACLFIHRCCLYCLAFSEALIKPSLRMQSTSPTKVWFHYASFWRGLTLLANRITTVSNAAPVSMFMAAVGWAEPTAMHFPCCGLTISAKSFRLVGSTIRSLVIWTEPCRTVHVLHLDIIVVLALPADLIFALGLAAPKQIFFAYLQRANNTSLQKGKSSFAYDTESRRWSRSRTSTHRRLPEHNF